MYFKVYLEMLILFRNAGWELVFQRCNSHNLSWYHDLTYSFNGNTTRIKTLQLSVIEESIDEATHFPIEGERWFKKQQLQNVDLNFFWKEDCQNQGWNLWVLQNMLKPEWSTILRTIQFFFTYEGRYP